MSENETPLPAIDELIAELRTEEKDGWCYATTDPDVWAKRAMLLVGEIERLREDWVLRMNFREELRARLGAILPSYPKISNTLDGIVGAFESMKKEIEHLSGEVCSENCGLHEHHEGICSVHGFCHLCVEENYQAQLEASKEMQNELSDKISSYELNVPRRVLSRLRGMIASSDLGQLYKVFRAAKREGQLAALRAELRRVYEYPKTSEARSETRTLVGGEVVTNVHQERHCLGRACAIHRPSTHVMSNFPQHWRGDRGMIERICPHGVGHPDPDHLDWLFRVGGADARNLESTHGCCGYGCCDEPATEPAP